MQHFDYVIIGAGSAGCVLADRLSRSGEASVLVLEAGGTDRRFWIKTPIGYGRTFAADVVNWKYQTAASPGLNDRTMYWPRGRALGGSSSINALVYCRGLPEDFDDWQRLGNLGWSWQDVRPYFERSERRVDAAGNIHGDGPLDVQDVTPRLHGMRSHWLDAAAELGIPVTEDFNGDQPAGFGSYPITTRHGMRRSAADAFLRPAMRRHNVQVLTHAWVSKIRIVERRAVGVDYRHGDQVKSVHAVRSVLLCAGTVNSPQLLQLSGIGPAARLQSAGIEPILDNPAVGGNLQDHLAVVYSFKATRATLNNELHTHWRQLIAGVRYLTTRRGPLALSVNQFGGFVSSTTDGGPVDLQLYCNPVTYAAGDASRTRINVDAFAGFYLCAQPTRPTSLGRIDIVSPDFRCAPRIAPNYLSTPKDETDALNGGRFLQAIARTRAMRSLIRAPMEPDLCSLQDPELLADFRARAATVYHPVGTCRMGPARMGPVRMGPAGMGPAALESVVDDSLRVHGIRGLRVVDASVFPTLTSANTNAPTLMVAQKGADLILQQCKESSA